MTDLEEKKLEERIKAFPLEEVFPQPDYNALLKQGVNPLKVALAHALRDEIRDKPPKSGPVDLRRYEYYPSEYWEETDKAKANEILRGYALDAYINEVKLSYAAAKQILAGESIGSKIYNAVVDIMASESDEIFSAKQQQYNELLFSSLQAKAKTKTALMLVPAVNTQYVRVQLYEHYGHDVSFRPLEIETDDNEAAVLDCSDINNIKIVAWAFDLDLCSNGAVTFRPGGLKQLVSSPEIQKWYENELEKTKEKSQEQENEKEEVLEDDLDNGMGY